MAKTDLTAQRLREVLDYDPLTGLFFWLPTHPRNGNSVRRGTQAGYLEDFGYIVIRIKREPYKAHRLAWLWMTGSWPADEVDHRNHNRSDNKWSNLRAATRKQNNENKLPTKSNRSNVCGVVWHSRDNRWQATIRPNGTQIHIGTFDRLEDAVAARHHAERIHFTHSLACEPQA